MGGWLSTSTVFDSDAGTPAASVATDLQGLRALGEVGGLDGSLIAAAAH